MSTLNPLDHPICLAQPARLAPSQWLEHAPLAMFLIDLIRPRTFVEIGTHFGVSYCAFCQAVQALGLQTRCFAVDTWTGDAQSYFYGPEVLADLREHHDPRYGGFSALLEMPFDAAAARFAPGSIDLLHLDGCHNYAAVRHDFDTLLSRMSARGLMLFHDIEVRRPDFGVWRLWEELAATRRTSRSRTVTDWDCSQSARSSRQRLNRCSA
jgi:predicted O-methyltransferase YrrM